MEKYKEIAKRDFKILKSLYLGNHLNNEEIERAIKLLYLLNLEIKIRGFKTNDNGI